MTTRAADEGTKLVFLAMERGYITPEQAMECCSLLKEGQESFALDAYLHEKGWLEPSRYEELRQRAAELRAPDALQTIDESVSLLNTIQRTLSIGPSSSSIEGITLDSSLDLPSAQEVVPSFTGLQAVDPTKWQPMEGPEQRYSIGAVLGSGGLGCVHEAFDLNLGRKVARKTLLKGKEASPQELRMFIEEARLTGQLEHPNIMPVYEIGRLEDEQLYYTMRLMPPNSLEQAISEKQFTPHQAAKILQQVCMGLEYAHSRGVVHRDIKPANILMGQFGEVFILDWGTAKIIEVGENEEGQTTYANTTTQSIKGTPAYMAPEMIRANQVSPASDQFALGVVLYEMITGGLPIYDENLYTLLFQICVQEITPPRKRAPERNIPEELEQICLKMLSKDPKARFASCREVYEVLEEFLEGTKDKERRHQAACLRLEEAEQIVKEYYANQARTQSLKQAWEDAQRDVKPWEGLEKKRQVWEKENAYRLTQQNIVSLFGEAIQKYEQVLENESGNVAARRGLAELHWSRFLEAEQDHDELQQIYHRDLVRFYDDGTYTNLLDGKGTLELSTTPEGAHVKVFRYEEQDRRLVPVLFEEVGGVCPTELRLPMGSYLLSLSKEGFRDVLYPVCLKRCERAKASVKLYTEEEIGSDFVYVPAGSFRFGGDPEAMMSLPLQERFVEDFFISRYPVTFGEYMEFLNATHRESPARAKSLIPRSIGEEEYAFLNEQGEYVPQYESLLTGPITRRYPQGLGHENKIPVFGVSWSEALQYCHWRSKQEGRRVSLPTEVEWEKAAAGADRRVFPWGNAFEATFCKMGRSRPPEELQPEPVGSFAEDRSPYGVCDLIGTIGEWMMPQEDPQANPQKTVDEQQVIVQRGGGWISSNENVMRIGSRILKVGGPPSYNCGIRLVVCVSKK